jgi:hypothetical protein
MAVSLGLGLIAFARKPGIRCFLVKLPCKTAVVRENWWREMLRRLATPPFFSLFSAPNKYHLGHWRGTNLQATTSVSKAHTHSMKFKRPLNDYVEESRSMWLWALIFGPAYLAYKQAWKSFIISSMLFMMFLPTGLGSLIVWVWLVFNAHRYVRKAYLRKGWIEVTE